MFYDDAVFDADVYTQATGKEAFVYWDDDQPGGFSWCSEDEYYYGWCQWVYPQDVVYSTVEGRYD